MFKRSLFRFTRTASCHDLRPCAAVREAKRRTNKMIQHEIRAGLRGTLSTFATE